MVRYANHITLDWDRWKGCPNSSISTQNDLKGDKRCQTYKGKDEIGSRPLEELCRSEEVRS